MVRKEILFNEENYTRAYYLKTIEMLKEDDMECDWEEDNEVLVLEPRSRRATRYFGENALLMPVGTSFVVWGGITNSSS